MYKAICFDLDGTLLNSKKTISDKTANLINRLALKKIKIIIATGRNYDFSLLLTKKLTSERVIISNNGSFIANTEKTTLYCKYIKTDIVLSLYNLTNKYPGLTCHMYPDPIRSNYDLLVNIEDDRYSLVGSSVRDISRIITMNSSRLCDNILSVVFHGNEKQILSLAGDLVLFNESLSFHIMREIYGDKLMLEIMPYNTNKLNAIKLYLENHNINLNETLSFGDNINDYEMLMESGLGIAMKNSSCELLSKIKRISSFTNDEDGVYYELLNLYEKVL